MKLKPQVPEEKNKGSFKTRRLECIENLASEVKGMDFKGKEYLTVAVRHNHLLKYFPESRIEEEIVFQDDKYYTLVKLHILQVMQKKKEIVHLLIKQVHLRMQLLQV